MWDRMGARVGMGLVVCLGLASISCDSAGSADSAGSTGPEASEGDTRTVEATALGPGPTGGPTGGPTAPSDDDTTEGNESDGTSSVASTGHAASTGSTGSTGASSGGQPGLGMLMGECGLIDAMELDSPEPFAFDNAVDFRGLGFDYDQLTEGGQAVFDAGNLGGSSLHSEVIAFEVLARCEGAVLLATEVDIQYVDPMGRKTDLRVEIDGRPVGVSVTRAVGFPPDDPYTEMQAASLLSDKLEDILASTANVTPRDGWSKQILHVIAYSPMHAQSIAAAYAELPPELTADTVLLVTVTHGNDEFIY